MCSDKFSLKHALKQTVGPTKTNEKAIDNESHLTKHTVSIRSFN